MQQQITNHLLSLFESSPFYYMKVQPNTHVRITHGEKWIFKSTDEYLKAYDKRKEGARTFNRKQQMVRSHEYKKELQWVAKRDGFDLAAGSYIMVFMKHMPPTWRKGKRKLCKRDLMAWQPMRVRPDVDNYLKKMADSLMKEDGGIWCAGILKIWIPDEIEEGTYFINVPVIFESVISHLKWKLSAK